MSDSAHPRFFHAFPMRAVTAHELDDVLADDTTTRVLFLWGRDCPNCDLAKGEMLLAPERFRWPDVEWLHDNVYDDRAMAVRFGLHGIPAFMVFRGARKLGRITPWPGADAFVAAIERVRSGET
ncbi:MAG: thioredoxin family protein [Lysobacter sp.]|nr:thioredoxin family protein [Lysobacter sp.]